MKNPFNRSRDILVENRNAGVLVKYIYEKDLEKQFTDDVIIIDEKFAGTLALDNRSIGGVTLSTGRDIIDKANATFRIATNGAKEF